MRPADKRLLSIDLNLVLNFYRNSSLKCSTFRNTLRKTNQIVQLLPILKKKDLKIPQSVPSKKMWNEIYYHRTCYRKKSWEKERNNKKKYNHNKRESTKSPYIEE